jgi:cytochrome c peroxidase
MADSLETGKPKSQQAQRNYKEIYMQAKLIGGVLALGLSLALMPGFGSAQVVDWDLKSKVRAAAIASDLVSLHGVEIPEVENILDFLKSGPAARKAALQLGKALFGDMQAGSDGQACASCHFHAGADNRARNQLSPGLKAVPEDTLFGNNFLGVPGFPKFKPDYTLVAADFPFHQLEDPEENNFLSRVVLKDTNDVVSSMGVLRADFLTVIAGLPIDIGIPRLDQVFNQGTPNATSILKNVRRVEPRNTPTMINAVFNHSNFWDGRAHNLFNGVSVIGPLDPGAKIWVKNNAGNLVQQEVRIPNSSLASQAVGPPTSNLEMSFFNRPFPLIGRKLLSLKPLGLQKVDPNDSVLGSLANRHGPGLNTSYKSLIQAAFQKKYWDSEKRVNIPGVGQVSLMEANFTLFWGLAVQIFESTLVSDRTPFDLFMEGNNTVLSPEQIQGLLVFLNRGARGNNPAVDAAILDFETKNPEIAIGAGNCISCHGGPLFSDATFPALADGLDLELIEIEDTTVLDGGLLAVSAVQGLLDNGFSNIGTRPTNDDLGRGGIEGGFPLSFTRQMLDPALNFLLEDVIEEFPCIPGTDCPGQLLIDGAFKIPGLRIVELTGPYFHNGGQATLSQVVEFYDRQSDFADVNILKVDRNMVFIDLEDGDEEPLVEFLLALTDPRVRNEKAPFDHPQLFVPNGGTVTSFLKSFIEIPAVGKDGRPAAGLDPLETFLNLDHVD